MLYRICTEDKNRDHIHTLVQEALARAYELTSYTLIPSEGYWKGNREKSLTIEIAVSYVNPTVEEIILNLAQAIKGWNQQEAILVQVISSTNTIL